MRREGAGSKMGNEIFNSMEIDAIGEIMNISLGSSATAVSNMLDHRVDITTPKVSVVNAEDFSFERLEPAIGVEIKYVTGLEGSNVMLLKMSDVKAITDILLGMETPDEEFELNELTLSAVCEVMNQMMGAASTALSDFLGRMVNISTPQTFDANDLVTVKADRLPVETGPIVVVQFALSIEDSVQSEFINVISVELAKELVSGFGLSEESSEVTLPEPAAEESSGGKLSQEQIEAMMAGAMGGESAPAPAAEEPSGGKLSQEQIEAMMAGAMGGGSAPAPAAEEPSGGKLSQEQIEAMMAGAMGGGSAPAPAAEEPSGGKLSQEQIEAMMAGAMGGGNGAQTAAPPPQTAPAPQPAPQPPAAGAAPAAYGAPGGWGMPPEMLQMQQMMMQQMQQMQQQMAQMRTAPEAMARKQADSKVIETRTPSIPTLEDGTELSEEQSQNLDLIMSVPLEVAVEIGRTRKKVQEILALSKGSLVVLDKLAGDQVDVYVNGKCIAHGDVVVIDDNFGIRISEIIRKPGLEDLK